MRPLYLATTGNHLALIAKIAKGRALLHLAEIQLVYLKKRVNAYGKSINRFQILCGDKQVLSLASVCTWGLPFR